MTTIAGSGSAKISIDCTVAFTIGPDGTIFHSIEADAILHDGMLRFDPSIALTTEDSAKLQRVLADAVIQHVARESAAKLKLAGGGTPTVQTAVVPDKGVVH